MAERSSAGRETLADRTVERPCEALLLTRLVVPLRASRTWRRGLSGARPTLVATFSANLETLAGAAGHPDTMKFWAEQPAAWDAHRRDLESPQAAMRRYLAWLDALPGNPVFVGYPAAYDFLFTYWYLMRFAGRSPFSHSALDIKTLAMAVLGKGYRDASKKNMPKHWFDPLPHTHVALDDAIEQGALFCNILHELRRSRGADR